MSFAGGIGGEEWRAGADRGRAAGLLSSPECHGLYIRIGPIRPIRALSRRPKPPVRTGSRLRIAEPLNA